MKTLGKIKLNQFSKAELDQRALNALKGGCDYCYYSCEGGGSNCEKGNDSSYCAQYNYTYTNSPHKVASY